MRALIFALLLPLSMLTPACSPQAAENTPTPAATTAVHPVSGLEVIPLTVTSPRGPHRFRVEVARTPQEQAKGLMFRTEMAPDEGMLFPYDQPRMLSFWMRNTVIPLDLVFIDAQHRIINIAENATPYSEASILSEAPGVAVLELNGGRTRALGIVAGNKVDW
ncbi:MAG TPA: DUF192 domain-containing protein [Croceibacterium sp.]|nr:DUF192 domain-containing protein [Croceibacterium sp.]